MSQDSSPLLGIYNKSQIQSLHRKHEILQWKKVRKVNCMMRSKTLRKCVLVVIALCCLSIIYFSYVIHSPLSSFIHGHSKVEANMKCKNRNVFRQPQNHSSETDGKLRNDPKVLVFVETMYSKLGREIAEILVYTRIKYKIEVTGKSLPMLTAMDKGRYGVVIFENYNKYLQMDKWNRELLDKYCKEYEVGIIGFISPSEEALVGAQLKGFPLFIHTNLKLVNAGLNIFSQVLRLIRAGETYEGPLPGDDWTVFQANHSTYEPVEWAHRYDSYYSKGQPSTPLTTVIEDHGEIDGIRRILFGSGLKFWLHRLLLLDSLSYLSKGQLSLSLERMILIDIDDIFVGEVNTRLKPQDVKDLIKLQEDIRSHVPGFKFNLGFSGKYYHHGNDEEDAGDDELLKNIEKFMWFSHMWNHQQPHLYDNLTQLTEDMMLNKNFAREKGIPVDSGYSVSPHHSGVYPTHDLLYTAWKKVWNIRVTSTEEYPHLRPARLRRGFTYKNIMVLPRQTCGLFTHTIWKNQYPGGMKKLNESIFGGELFQTIVYNPINIFMTHMSNYGNDKLARYTFKLVIQFLNCWTNIKLISAPPLQLAEKYFKLFPEENEPIWGNPCDDPRHKKIWSRNKSCDSLPNLLIIGPQKTGTTALHNFLLGHPSFASSLKLPETYEEVQFFNANNYLKGLDWYMSRFPSPLNSSIQYLFEKSATYFDGDLVPKRVHALLPHVKLVTILMSPAKRAYSWYQHIKAKGDLVANNYSFYQVIMANDTDPKSLRDLRNRCLNPGKYAQHLERWLTYFPPQQLHIIDGDLLKSNPIEVMSEIQKFLKVTPVLNYTTILSYVPKKGYYCKMLKNRPKCLGTTKGRHYPPMDEKSLKHLQKHYMSHNTNLVKLMKRLGIRNIPDWLKNDLSHTPT